MKEQIKPIRIGIEAAISLVLMSGVPVCVKFTSATALTIGLFRLSVAVLLFAFLMKPLKNIRAYPNKVLVALIPFGLVFSIHWITYFLSIKLSTASIGFLGVSTYGVHLIFLGRVIKKTKPRNIDYLALICTIAGTYLVVPEFSFSNDYTIGILLAIFSGLCFAILPILNQHYDYIPDKVRIFSQFFFAWVVFLLLYPWTSWDLNPIDWYPLLYLAIFGTVISHTLWVRVTTRISTVVTSLIFYLAIPMTMVISHFWLNEPMPIVKIGGALLIVIANIVGMSGRIK